MRILIGDDDLKLCRLVADYLAPMGYDVDAAHNGSQGLEMILTPIEYDLLTCLARSAGRVLSRDQLLDAVAGRDYEVFDRSVDVHISSLRRKLGEDPRNPRYIQTVRSAGYMFKGSEHQES